MACHPELKWVSAVSQPGSDWKGFKGRVTDHLRALDSSYPWAETDFYLCGNGQMITEVKAILADRGVTKDAIHQEKYY
jgi:ferredoxin-NADP reductase